MFSATLTYRKIKKNFSPSSGKYPIRTTGFFLWYSRTANL
jgi:hypothetical protein